MSKFKIGDKVARLAGGNSSKFISLQGSKEYYTVTGTTNQGYWLQLDGVHDKYDAFPWNWGNFKLYQEPVDDELPPAPTDVLYVGVQDYYRALRARTYNSFGTGKLLVDLHIGGGALGDGKSCSLSADDVLQLAHDLRRMAMDIKRKEKAQ